MHMKIMQDLPSKMGFTETPGTRTIKEGSCMRGHYLLIHMLRPQDLRCLCICDGVCCFHRDVLLVLVAAAGSRFPRNRKTEEDSPSIPLSPCTGENSTKSNARQHYPEPVRLPLSQHTQNFEAIIQATAPRINERNICSVLLCRDQE